MAAAAITQAIYESAIPIAAQDAKTYTAVDLQNLNNQQQATLQNAMTYAWAALLKCIPCIPVMCSCKLHRTYVLNRLNMS